MMPRESWRRAELSRADMEEMDRGHRHLPFDILGITATYKATYSDYIEHG